MQESKKEGSALEQGQRTGLELFADRRSTRNLDQPA